MRLRLSKRWLNFFQCFIWGIYGLFFVYSFLNNQYSETFLTNLFLGFTIYLSIILFLKHWYFYKQPKLLDWFRLGIFLTLISNFFFLSKEMRGGLVKVTQSISVHSSWQLTAILAIFTGLIAIRLGEYVIESSFFKKFSVRRLKEVSKFRHENLFYLLSILIVILQFYLLITGIVGYGHDTENTISNFSFIVQFVGYLSPLFLATYAILKYLYGFSKPIFNILFWIIFGTLLCYGLFTGMKESTITPILIVAFPYIMSGRNIKKSILIVGVFFLLLLYPFNNNYRDILNENSGINKSVAITLSIDRTLDQNLSENFIAGSESYQSRTSLLPIFMYSLSVEDEWKEYKHMNRYLLLPLSWIIPRFIWASKPLSDTGSKFSVILTGNEKNSVTPSTFGWSYFEGGMAYVFFTFLIFGLLIAFIQLSLDKKNIFHLLLFILITISLVKIEADIYFRISGILQMVLVTYIFYRIFFKTRKFSNGGSRINLQKTE